MDMDQLLTNSKLKQAFEMFDEDGSGVISADEIKSVLGLASDQTMNDKINEIIRQVDVNGDGEVSFEEFKEMMKAIAEWFTRSKQIGVNHSFYYQVDKLNTIHNTKDH